MAEALFEFLQFALGVVELRCRLRDVAVPEGAFGLIHEQLHPALARNQVLADSQTHTALLALQLVHTRLDSADADGHQGLTLAEFIDRFGIHRWRGGWLGG